MGKSTISMAMFDSYVKLPINYQSVFHVTMCYYMLGTISYYWGWFIAGSIKTSPTSIRWVELLYNYIYLYINPE